MESDKSADGQDSAIMLTERAEGADYGERVVTARGTEDGLVLRIDGKAPWDLIVEEMTAFLGSRRRFLEGGEVLIEWLERLPTNEQSSQLEQFLRDECGVTIVSRRRRPAFTTITSASSGKRKVGEKDTEEAIDSSRQAELFNLKEERSIVRAEGADRGDGVDHYGTPQERSRPVMRDSILKEELEILNDSGTDSYMHRMARILGEDLPYEEDANAKIVFGTFRSGQRIETPFSLIVMGDVNPGADLVAGGDIVVLGSLRGTAHAAAYDDEAQERVIMALSMQPMQLRIGSVISRGSDEAGRGAEVARIESRRIIVESFNARTLFAKRQRNG